MASHAERVKRDIDRWVRAGLITGAVGDTLARETDSQAADGISFGSVLALFAAVLFAAAVLIFIAANWEYIPRLVRVLGIFALIAGGYLGGAVLKERGHEALGEAAWLAAAGAFGGGIALIGQMYHLAGRESDAMLTWCLGTAVAAGLLASRPLTVGTVAVALAWLCAKGASWWESEPFPFLYPLLAAAIWAVSMHSNSRTARDLLMLSLTIYLVLLSIHLEPFAVGLSVAAGAGALFLIAAYYPAEVESVLRLDGHAPFHFLMAGLIGLALVQADLADKPAFALAAAATFAAIAGALLLGGRQSRAVRRLAYFGFALEVGFVYLITVGTMLDTASFFLVSAVLVGVLAVVILRIERRLRPLPPSEVGAAA